MKQEYQHLIESIMKLVAAEFGPKCEVVLHDWSKEYDKTIVAIENGHVSGRHIGGSGSNLGLEVMRGTVDGSNQLNYLSKTAEGRILRSSSLYLKDETGERIGALCINYDITDFVAMQNQISEITLFPNATPDSDTQEFFTSDVNELLERLLQESVRMAGKSPADMTREEKKQAINYLDQKGALLITGAGSKICQHFGMSKYTLYSYLDEAHKRKENVTEKEA